MSIDHVSRVLNLPPSVNGTDRLVLLVLAEAAHTDTEECWPSVTTIMRRAGLRQERYVQKAVAALAEAGLVEVDPNGCPDHRIRANRRPNLYRMAGAMALDRGGARRAGSSSSGGARRAGQGVRDALFAPYIEPEVKPDAALQLSVSDPFDAFWGEYPRRREKIKARKAWQAQVKRGAAPSDLTAAAANYARARRSTPPDKIKLPATFLSADDVWRDWLDGGAALAEAEQAQWDVSYGPEVVEY